MAKPPPLRLPAVDLVDELYSGLATLDIPDKYKLLIEFVLLSLIASKDLTSWGTIGLSPNHTQYQLGLRSASHPRFALFTTEAELEEELDYALSTARKGYNRL